MRSIEFVMKQRRCSLYQYVNTIWIFLTQSSYSRTRTKPWPEASESHFSCLLPSRYEGVAHSSIEKENNNNSPALPWSSTDSPTTTSTTVTSLIGVASRSCFTFKKGSQRKGVVNSRSGDLTSGACREGRNNPRHKADEVTERFSSRLNLDLCRWRVHQKM